MSKAQPVKALASLLETIFGREEPAFKKKNASIAFLNAQSAAGTLLTTPEFISTMVCEQAVRPLYLELEEAGFKVFPELSASATGFDVCLVLTGKFRALNEVLIFKASTLTRKGGLIIVSGAKDVGIASLCKRIAPERDIAERVSKYHSMAFCFRNDLAWGSKKVLSTSNQVIAGKKIYQTFPGLFSADRIDQGSALLSTRFNEKIGGKIADLGAGWGYLSSQLSSCSNNITKLDLYEADWRGINACRKNLQDVSDTIKMGFFWSDVISETINRRYDWVIMNPPFHQERRTRSDLGQAFIEKASLILKPTGQLLMVANQRLAYERTIGYHFSTHKILDEREGFKIILAKKVANV